MGHLNVTIYIAHVSFGVGRHLLAGGHHRVTSKLRGCRNWTSEKSEIGTVPLRRKAFPVQLSHGISSAVQIRTPRKGESIA